MEEVTVVRKTNSTKMAETDDAYTLVSPASSSIVYADYANSMKHLANQARIEETKAGKIAYNKEAKRKYQTEVDSLTKKLDIAQSNVVKERAAQRMTYAAVQKKQNAAKEARHES